VTALARPARPRRVRRQGAALARWVVVAAVAAIAIGPFLYVLSSALKSESLLFTYPPEWVPSNPTLVNFKHALESGWVGWLGNTMLISGAVAIFKLAFDSMAAFAFSKLSFPGRRFLFAVMVIAITVPPVALIIPLYFLVRDLDGLNTYWALILPPMANPIGIFMLRSFIDQLPPELEQAGRVDGASPWARFRHVVLPLIKPGLVVVGLYLFLVQYTNFLWPLVIAPDLEVLTTGLARIVPIINPDWGLISATALLSMVPITVLFVLFQRHFVATSFADAVKG
jgi:multiple sugar transport system permease protein